jgi:hypothetical protein
MGHPNSIEHRGGRPKGSVNFRTRQVQTFCRSVCEDPLYRQDIVDRARSGNLGAMEAVIWAYAYGRPKESIDLHIGPIEEDLSSLSAGELAQRAEDIMKTLREAAELEAALPAEYRTVLSVDSSEVAKTPAVSTQSPAVDANSPAESGVNASKPAENLSGSPDDNPGR